MSRLEMPSSIRILIASALLCLIPGLVDLPCQAQGSRSGIKSGTIYSNKKLEEDLVIGKVVSVSPLKLNQDLLEHTGMVSKVQSTKVEILEGPFKGQTVEVDNEITDNPAYNVEVKNGQEVVLAMESKRDGEIQVNIADYHRAPSLTWLLVAFLVAFIAFGGKQGVKSLIGLGITVLLIGWVLLPLSLQGFNPLLISVVICLLATASSILLIGGLSKKSAAAIAGTVGGVIIAGFAAQIVIWTAPLTGLSSEEAQILRGSVLVQQPPFYSGLLAAGMLIGALGVIMDVGISIASSIAEVSRADRKLPMKALFESGMNVGRDIMGTMTNTLILAYTGGALPLLLLATQMPSIKLINLDLFATEVASALSGSLGLVFTIPLTALVAARIMSSENISNHEG
ncbi:MAG: YibE/F family protein [Cyanobacteria bacterium HKST-UBA02]|nr:YibE/F family protein [Cyanobacteria bacterium HKST-UBA02]